eukprot:COSAG06_NODE_73162_length_162_cov_2.238095_1_plen_48_part_01
MHDGASVSDPAVPQPSLQAQVYAASRAVQVEPVSPLLAHGLGGGSAAP